MTSRPARRTTGRAPARSARAQSAPDAGGGPSPVDVRLMGEDAAVRRLVAALQQSADCGPATYKSMRDSAGTRAYLSVVVPAPREDAGHG